MARTRPGARGELTDKPVSAMLPDLLQERGMSVRALAEAIGVNQSYLSRILGASDPDQQRRASAEVAGLIAEELGLPRDYFPEYREAKVVEAIRTDHRLRDRVYGSLPRGKR